MRKAYRRRESGPKQTWSFPVTGLIMLPMTVILAWVFVKDAVLRPSRIDWLLLPQGISLAAMFGVMSFGAFAAAIWPRWARPEISEHRSPIDPQKLDEIRLTAHVDSAPLLWRICLALTALFFLSLLFGVAVLFRPEPDLKQSFTGVGLGLMFGAIFGTAGFRFRRVMQQPNFIAITRQGIRFGKRKEQFVPWLDVKEISVRPKNEQEAYPEQDEIAVTFRDGVVRRRKSALEISPMSQFGIEPSKVLGFIERFRPSTVPVHDPRRIEEPSRD